MPVRTQGSYPHAGGNCAWRVHDASETLHSASGQSQATASATMHDAPSSTVCGAYQGPIVADLPRTGRPCRATRLRAPAWTRQPGLFNCGSMGVQCLVRAVVRGRGKYRGGGLQGRWESTGFASPSAQNDEWPAPGGGLVGRVLACVDRGRGQPGNACCPRVRKVSLRTRYVHGYGVRFRLCACLVRHRKGRSSLFFSKPSCSRRGALSLSGR